MQKSPAKKSLIGAIPYHLWTLFLFTKSDFKTVIMPLTVYGATTGPMQGFSRLPHIVLWLWIHLLSFDIANQAMFIEEDRANKPYRPIPAGRISVKNAFRLRYAVLIIGFILSAFYSKETLAASVAALITQSLYSDLRLDASHWAIRNVMGAVILAPFLLGANLVAGINPHKLDQIGMVTFILSNAITLTTFHCQDFKDVKGDALVGRKTFPMVHPSFSRIAYMFAVISWSFASSTLYRLDSVLTGLLVAYATLIGSLVAMFRSVKADQLSYLLFEFWQTFVFLAPAYYRYKFNNEPLADNYPALKAVVGGL